MKIFMPYGEKGRHKYGYNWCGEDEILTLATTGEAFTGHATAKCTTLAKVVEVDFDPMTALRAGYRFRDWMRIAPSPEALEEWAEEEAEFIKQAENFVIGDVVQMVDGYITRIGDVDGN